MNIDIQSFTHLVKNSKRSTEGLKTYRLAIMADSASQFVAKAIKGTGIEYGVNYQIFEADYNQIDRQVFDFGSELYEFKPTCVLILRSTEKLIKQFYSLSKAGKITFAEQQVTYTAELFNQVSNSLGCSVIFNTFPETHDTVFGNFSSKTTLSFPFQIKKLNLGLMSLSQEKKNLFVLQLDSLMNRVGTVSGFDPKMYIGGDMVYSLDLLQIGRAHV